MSKAYVTTYCDGDQLGCVWAGTVHASTSSRSAQYRGGGRERDFEDDYDVGVVAMQGWGMPEVRPATIDYATLPGGLIQHVKTGMRQWQLTFEAASPSLSAIHTARDYLVEAFKPDRVSPQQPVRLRYYGATTPVEIDAWYVGGLEGSLVGEDGVVERPVARLLSEDPLWYAIGNKAAVLDGNLTVSDADYIMKRIDGLWSNVSTNFNSGVYAITRDGSGNLYVGGGFTNVGDANGDYIVMVSPAGVISSLGTGCNGLVTRIVIGPSGTVYVGGQFTSAGGIANTSRIAQWDGTNWTALGTGALDQDVQGLVIDQSGVLYATGGFTQMGGVASTARIAKWDGANWSALSSGLDNNSGCALAVGLDGSVYVVGSFTAASGVSNTARIAKWNGTVFSALGTGLTGGTAYRVSIASDGSLYAGGDFTSAGGVSANRIARWNGTSWSALGDGVNGTLWGGFVISDEGILYALGAFTTAGGLSLADYMAAWNGSTWFHIDVDLPGAPTSGTFLCYQNDLYIGYSAGGTAYASGQTTVTNSGSRTAYPRVKVSRSGGTTARVEYLRNETTGDTLYLNYSLLNGETLTIDLGYRRDPTTGEAKTAGRKRITSSFSGNVIGRALLAGSDFAAFGLAPGSNTISLYVYEAGAPTVTAWTEWREPYWSIDGAI